MNPAPSAILIPRSSTTVAASLDDAIAAITILIVDDQAIIREPIAAALNLSGYKTICAVNGKEAITAVRAARPNLVLLDVLMPGMNAWGFLNAIRTESAGNELPVILLTSATDKGSILQARDQGIREYILKEQFSLDDLLKRVKRTLEHPTSGQPTATEAAGTAIEPSLATSAAASGGAPPQADSATRPRAANITGPPASGGTENTPAPRLLTRDEVIARVEKFAQVKTLPGVVLNVINLASSPRSSVDELVAVLKRDPVLASRILHIANSPSHASRKGRVTTVTEAVRNVGLATVCNIAASAGIFEAFGGSASGGIDLLRCWQHSFAVADIMDRLVPKSDAMPAGLPYLIGLCHDLGEIALRQKFAEEYGAACDIAARSGRLLEQVESEVFGISHQELVGLLSSKLTLPELIATPITEFIHRQRTKTLESATGLTQALFLANTLAHGLLLASSADARVQPFSTAEYSAGFGDSDAATIDFVVLRGEAITNTNLLARLSTADESALSQPILPAQEVKLWYTRPASMARFDPLGVALQLLAHTDAHDSHPVKPEDVAGCDGVVIVQPLQISPASAMIQIERLRKEIQNVEIPVLCLPAAGHEVSLKCPQNLEFMQYPVPLSHLHRFISRLATT